MITYRVECHSPTAVLLGCNLHTFAKGGVELELAVRDLLERSYPAEWISITIETESGEQQPETPQRAKESSQ